MVCQVGFGPNPSRGKAPACGKLTRFVRILFKKNPGGTRVYFEPEALIAVFVWECSLVC